MINLTLKDAEAIFWALGIIQGVAAGVNEAQAEMLFDAAEKIEFVLRGE